LHSELQLAALQQDHARQIRVHALLATAEGRYDFADRNLNDRFPHVRTVSFEHWFRAKWHL